MIETITESISIQYIIAVMCATSVITYALQRYIPALTPDSIEQVVLNANNPALKLFREDWKKIVTVIVGAAFGALFNAASWADPGVLIASFGMAVVGYSYGWKYVAKWAEIKLKDIN